MELFKLNNLVYADAIFLIIPSSSGMQRLLNICRGDLGH